MKNWLWIVVLCVAIPAWAGCLMGVKPAADAVSVGGDVGQARSWTAAEIRRDFAGHAKTITYTSRYQNHTALVLPLLAIATAAGPRFDEKIKNDPLRFVVAVQGRDGYVATFAWPELMPELGNREAWVALEIDGKPLPDRDAPASLIVPGDQKAGRWVHGIQSIRVLDVGAKAEVR